MRESKKRHIKELISFSKDFAFIANNVSYVEESIAIIKEISLAIKHGETFVLIGLSGSGKTTLLKLLYGLISPSSGEILINGNDTNDLDPESLTILTREMSFVFQYGSLINNLNVFDNLALSTRYYALKNEKEIEEEINKQLNYFGILHRKDVRPAQLTINEMKLVSFSRILLRDYYAVILDDPFSSVDENTIRKMTTVIKNLKKRKKTILFSSTDLNVANKFADKIGIIDNGQMLFFGDKDELKNSNNKNLTELIKRIAYNYEETIEDAEEV